MAKIRKETTFEQRQLVIYHHAMGKSIRDVGKLLMISKSTVANIVNRFKNNQIVSKPRCGRPKILNEHDERLLMRTVKADPRISAPKLATVMSSTHNKIVCAETIRCTIRNHGYNGRIARKKPFVSEVNRKKRLLFAKEHLDCDGSFWETVLFSDESKFNLFGSDGRVNVWRKPNTEMEPKHLRATVKHGGGSLMVWGCFSAAGTGKLVFIDGIMNKSSYLAILKENMKSSAELLGINNHFKFYQDNDPKHTAHIVREWLLYNAPKVMKTPPQSPDMNPIENLWQILDVAIRKRQITNKTQLKTALIEEWANISTDITEKLIGSMPKRMEAVIKNNGNPTKY